MAKPNLCPKCGENFNVFPIYCRGILDVGKCRHGINTGDHLYHVCDQCKYEGLNIPCLDAEKKPDAA